MLGTPVRVHETEGRQVKPTLGRIVLYQMEEGDFVAAIVTDVLGGDDRGIEVTAFVGGQLIVFGGVLEGASMGTWMWPPRV